MKKSLVILLSFSVCLTLVNCSSGKKTASATDKPASEKVADVKAQYSEAQMEEGKTIWSGKCNKCHKLYSPESHSVEKWERVLPRMSNRANLDDRQAALVRAYLIAHASAS